MKGLKIVCSVIALLAILAGCATPSPTPTPAPPTPTPAPAAPTPTPTPAPVEKTIVIGFTASQTGKYNAESKEQIQGLNLWAEHLSAKGGIKIGNMIIKVQFKFYDDESTKERVQELYTRLITEDKVDYLISPYSSGLAAAAAVLAEQYSKVMIVTGAASDDIFAKGYKYVYQIYTPASRYLTGAIDMLKKVDPAARKIAFVYEKEKFSTDVVNYAKEYATKQGFEVVLFEGYEAGTTDFAPFINKIVAAAPDAIMGGGHFADGSTFAKQLYEKKVPAKLISILVAPALPEFAEIGEAAFQITGPSQWEPQAQYSEESAKKAGIPWYGPSVKEFVEAYKAKYGYEPGYHAAGGYAAGLVLQKAIEDAGSLEPDKVKAALEKMDILTFYGRIKFDTTQFYGKQIGHEMVYLQWQKDAAGKLVKQVVWPEEGRSAPLIYPRTLK